jgi:hypothetical protein
MVLEIYIASVIITMIVLPVCQIKIEKLDVTIVDLFGFLFFALVPLLNLAVAGYILRFHCLDKAPIIFKANKK